MTSTRRRPWIRPFFLMSFVPFLPVVASVVGLCGAPRIARAQTAAPAPPQPAPPPPASPTGARSLTDTDLAPIAVPSAVASSSDFARRLERACGTLRASNAPAAAARPFRVAPLGPPPAPGARRAPGPLASAITDALAGLRASCERIDAGQRLDAVDLDNLKAFRQDAALAETRIAQLLTSATATPETSAPLTFTSSGSLEADVIAGLATFIYDRAKQEAMLYLGRELGQRLCSETNRLFFPDLCLAIGDSDPALSLAAMGTYLATAARRDLDRLPDKVLAYQMYRLPAAAPATAREALVAARLGLAYFRAVAAGRTPLDTARSLHRLPATTPGATTTVFGATARASELLDAVVAQEGWATDVRSASDAVARRFALGTLFTLGDLFAEDGIAFAAPNPDQVAALVPVVARYLVEAKALGERAQQALAALRRRATAAGAGHGGDFTPADGGGGSGGGDGGGDGGGADLTARDYVAAATQTLQSTLQTGIAVAQKLGVLSPEASATVNRVAVVIELGEQLVAGKSPSELVIAGLDLLRQVSQKLGDADAAAAARVITDIKVVVVLMSQVAQAGSAEEVTTILEAAAAPISTYETKYRHPVVALGALVGAATGVEALRTDGAGWSTGWIAGAFAPVGITASTPVGARWHCGTLLSVINLGGLVSTRFSEDTRTGTGGTTETVKADPTVKLANVFAPGLWVTLGIYGSPLTFSLGGQVVPQGRQVVQASGATSSNAALQLLGTLSLDVPILTF